MISILQAQREANERVRTKLWKAGVLDALQEGDYTEAFAPALARAEGHRHQDRP